MLEDNNEEGAIREFREAIRLRPDYEEAYSWLGLKLKSMNDLSGAIAAYRHVVRLKPEDSHAHQTLAAVFFEAEYLDGAIMEYRTALKLTGEKDQQAYIHGQLGNIFCPRASQRKQLTSSEHRSTLSQRCPSTLRTWTGPCQLGSSDRSR